MRHPDEMQTFTLYRFVAPNEPLVLCCTFDVSIHADDQFAADHAADLATDLLMFANADCRDPIYDCPDDDVEIIFFNEGEGPTYIVSALEYDDTRAFFD